MKRIFYSLIFGILLLVASCRRAPNPDFEFLVTDTAFVHHGIDCRVQYGFTSIRNAHRSAALQAIQEANIARFFSLEAFTGDLPQAVGESLARFAEEAAPEGIAPVEWGVMQTIDSEARVMDTVLVYTISRASYTGGAHGAYATEVTNYSLRGGYELTLADLFTPVQLEALSGAIRRQLYAQYGATSDEELAEQGFFPETIAPSENFELMPDGILFRYNPYDIGCFALGAVEVALSREELQAL